MFSMGQDKNIIFMINGNLYYENIFTIDLTSRFL